LAQKTRRRRFSATGSILLMVLHVMDPLFDGINRKTLVGSFEDYNWIPGKSL
jgi:hypothetical protein